MATGVGFTFTTTVGVVDGVHRGTAGLGADTAVAVPTGFTDDHVGEVFVADGTHRRHTLTQDVAHLSGRKPQGDIFAVAAHDLSVTAGAAGDLAALTGIHLDVVDQGTDGDVFQLHRVARFDVQARFGGHDGIADLHAFGLKDVALLPVDVVDQADPAVAVRIVLDRRDPSLDTELVPLEIDDPVELFRSGLFMTGSDPAVVVASRFAGELLQQRADTGLRRDITAVQDRHKTTGGGGWFE